MILPPLTAWLTLGTLTLLFATAAQVGRARIRHRVKAPATHGDPAFERAFRVQMNTLENAVLFLPALWLCALSLGDAWAAGFGSAWLAARIWYAVAYLQDSSRRGNPFLLSMLAWGGLMLAATWGLVRAWP